MEALSNIEYAQENIRRADQQTQIAMEAAAEAILQKNRADDLEAELAKCQSN